MVAFARISAIAVIVMVLAMVLPGLFAKSTSVRVNTPILYYSPVLERFVMQGNRGAVDEQDNILTLRQYMCSLPFLYRTALVKWNQFPQTVGGVPVTPGEASRQLQFVRISPKDINVPSCGLHMLLESEPEGASLEMAADMFRLRDGIEFLRCETNSVDREKTEQFTSAMLQAGFTFPARAIGGEPDTRKPFDWGYFLVDDTNMLFHLRMVRGEPLCINTGKRFDQPVRSIFVKEDERREFYCAIVTQNDVFIVFCKNYELIRLPLDGYNPDKDVVMLLTSPLNRVVQLRGEDFVQGTALDNHWKPVHRYVLHVDRTSKVERDKLASLIFPFTLEANSPFTHFKPLNIKHFYAWPLWNVAGVLLCMGLYMAVYRIRFRKNPPNWELGLLAVTGLYGLIALIAVGRSGSDL
ncbi:DUF4857 domain-containing protein [Salidesulfovibrio onnuriiensis]|uniref:DUF4857 domain-containing protein n=1 Tax=Salidesulfovibrio onnuriiensis TaxID=2583823 RepID=UPI0011C85ED4|nr:DUF4857 domain-containing protein [Salidesulfovibrio onnuriiensis]